MSKLLLELQSGLVAGLRRQALGQCSKWTMQYRRTDKGPWRYDKHPWSLPMQDVDEDWVGMKAAQMSFTEICLNRSLYSIDWLKRSVLYILPTKTPDATDFSSDRFNAALEASPYLRNMFSDVQNVGHKRAGSRSLYIRGARSRSGLKSIPAGVLIFDEYDEMMQEMIILAEERQSGQLEKQDIRISTPTVRGKKIHAEFELSSQEHYEFRCPSCGKHNRFVDESCMVITGETPNDPRLRNSYYRCLHCHTKLPDDKSIWLNQENSFFVKDRSDYLKRGFHVPQFYSFTQDAWRIARLYLMSLTDPAAAQEYYNSKLGLPHESAATRIQESDITKSMSLAGKRTNNVSTGLASLRTIGIDVGAWLHVTVVEWIPCNEGRDINGKMMAVPVFITKVRDFEAVKSIINAWRPNKFVIDANPELRKSQELVDAYPGIGYRCFYSRHTKSKVTKNAGGELHVGRSYWLDIIFNRFRDVTRKIILPADTPLEFQEHLRNIIKRFHIDEETSDVSVKFVTQDADHYFHSLNYAEIALGAVGGLVPETEDIKEDV